MNWTDLKLNSSIQRAYKKIRGKNFLLHNQDAVNSWFNTNVETYLNDVKFNFIAVSNDVIPGDDCFARKCLTIFLSAFEWCIHIRTSSVMSGILAFLSAKGSPLVINVYPYFAYASDPTNLLLESAQFTETIPVVQDGS
ncbi:hypothetical protein DVH24_018194 [Malus domestica]|uniref:Uncharacterized protein n=1 Tax=Malus domestica TaxID=3750 RepID=A0A498KKK0_MALDO|nr:hypothetical protein DVH24_018194 [Malus domestica]